MKLLRASCLGLVVALGLLAAPAPAPAGGVSFDLGGSRLTRSMRTLKDIRDAQVVRQQWDMSCGSAALSTLLTYHHADPVPESHIIVSILRRTDPVKVRARGGFSLLDLKRFVEKRGYTARGYAELTVVDLIEFGEPAIVPVNINGYDHFVVVKEVGPDRVLLADPAFGNLTMRLGRFQEVWNDGIGLFVWRRGGRVPPDSLALRARELPVAESDIVTRLLQRTGVSPATRHGP